MPDEDIEKFDNVRPKAAGDKELCPAPKQIKPRIHMRHANSPVWYNPIRWNRKLDRYTIVRAYATRYSPLFPVRFWINRRLPK